MKWTPIFQSLLFVWTVFVPELANASTRCVQAHRSLKQVIYQETFMSMKARSLNDYLVREFTGEQKVSSSTQYVVSKAAGGGIREVHTGLEIRFSQLWGEEPRLQITYPNKILGKKYRRWISTGWIEHFSHQLVQALEKEAMTPDDGPTISPLRLFIDQQVRMSNVIAYYERTASLAHSKPGFPYLKMGLLVEPGKDPIPYLLFNGMFGMFFIVKFSERGLQPYILNASQIKSIVWQGMGTIPYDTFKSEARTEFANKGVQLMQLGEQGIQGAQAQAMMGVFRHDLVAYWRENVKSGRGFRYEKETFEPWMERFLREDRDYLDYKKYEEDPKKGPSMRPNNMPE